MRSIEGAAIAMEKRFSMVFDGPIETEHDDARNRMIFMGMYVDAIKLEETLELMVQVFLGAMGISTPQELVELAEELPRLIPAMKGLASKALLVGYELGVQEP